MPETNEMKLAIALAEVIANQGEESQMDYCKRLNAAEKVLRKIAPDILKAEKQKVAARNAE